MRNDNRIQVLHITNWYPGETNPCDALWIRRQIMSLDPFCENYVLHIQVIPSSKLRWSETRLKEGFQVRVEVPTERWALIECLTHFILRKWLRKLRVNENFDLVDFHIAYPLLTYWHKIKGSISIPVLVNEHWSAYHYSFNVSQPEKLKRIRQIFAHKLPIIAVSKSLKADIERFAQRGDMEFFIVPNAVDVSIFRSSGLITNKPSSFFMVSNWKYPKRPFVVIDGFAKFIVKNGLSHLRLVVGGYGPLFDEMKEYVKANDLEENITFLGRLNSIEIAGYMNASLGFVHPSDYETFSVVCAEALCCGTPLIASGVGGIKEFVSETNGFLVDQNTADAWVVALEKFWLRRHTYRKEEISRNAQLAFSMRSVGEQYFEVVREIYDRRDNGISSYT